jgi:hypothetical protein
VEELHVVISVRVKTAMLGAVLWIALLDHGDNGPTVLQLVDVELRLILALSLLRLLVMEIVALQLLRLRNAILVLVLLLVAVLVIGRTIFRPGRHTILVLLMSLLVFLSSSRILPWSKLLIYVGMDLSSN